MLEGSWEARVEERWEAEEVGEMWEEKEVEETCQVDEVGFLEERWSGARGENRNKSEELPQEGDH